MEWVGAVTIQAAGVAYRDAVITAITTAVYGHRVAARVCSPIRVGDHHWTVWRYLPPRWTVERQHCVKKLILAGQPTLGHSLV